MNIYYSLYSNNRKDQKAGHRTGYALLSYALEKEYRMDRLPKIERGRYGKPFFSDYPQIHFNISHCNGMAVCALARQEVGIDVEKRRQVSLALVKKALTEQEREELQNYSEKDFEMGFLQYWTLKESFIKAIGKGLSFPLNKIEFYLEKTQIFQNLTPLLEVQDINLFDWIPIASNQKDWQFFQFFLKKDYLLSLCFYREEAIYKEKCRLQEVILAEK